MGLPDAPHYVAGTSSHISNAWHEMSSPAPNSVVVPQASMTTTASAGNRPSTATSTMLQSSSGNNNNIVISTSATSDVHTNNNVSNIASSTTNELNPVEATMKGAQLDTMMVTDAIVKQPNVEEEEEEEDDDDEDDDEDDEMEHQTIGSVVDASSNPNPNPNPNPNLTGLSSGSAAAVAVANVGANGDEDVIDGEDLGDKGSAGTRWPRQEALALLKIRSDMDKAFKDNSPKAPLWDQVSSKMAELGYQRTAKKCKEKFENMHKYYKRTKEGKSGRPDGKNYRFFNQLEALYGKKNQQQINKNSNHSNANSNNNNNTSATSIDQNMINGGSTVIPGMNLQPPQYNIMDANIAANYSNSIAATPLAAIRPPSNSNALNIPSILPIINIQSIPQAPLINPLTQKPQELGSRSTNSDHSGTSLDSSFESSDEEDDDDEDDDEMSDDKMATATVMAPPPGTGIGDRPIRKKKKKRKGLKRYLLLFRDAMNKVLDKQEQMQQRFLEALERRDKERMMREDTCKRQEMARLNMESEMHAQETAVSASRDSAIIDLLQKLTGQSVVHHLHHQHQQHHLQQSVPMSSTTSTMPMQIPLPSMSIPMSSSMAVPIQIPSMPMPNYMQQPQHEQAAPINAPTADDSSLDYKDVSSSHDNKDTVSSPRSPSATAGGGTLMHHDGMDPSGNKRWPKPEVFALIQLRTSLDKRFHEPGSKAVLWEEISKGMSSQGYSRTAKRCKEKWENINKYFKKAKDNNKKRPEDAKTCPYFHKLNALYKQGLLGGGGYNLKQKSEPTSVVSAVKPADSAGTVVKPTNNVASIQATQAHQDAEASNLSKPNADQQLAQQIGVSAVAVTTTATTTSTAQINQAFASEISCAATSLQTAT